MKKVQHIVSYVDPDRPSEGTLKTRFFDTAEEARDFIRSLDSFAPNARDVQITRQTTDIKRERVW